MDKENIFELIKNLTLEILPGLDPEQVTIEKSLTDLGANSVDRMEVVTLSQEKLNVKVPINEFIGVENIQGLVDVLFKFKAETE